MRTQRQYKAQIMVIILLILSVLSIIAVSVTLNTTRDTEEQVQDKQYQQYYSVGERNIVDMIRYIGKDALTVIPTVGAFDVGTLSYTCSAPDSATRDCTIDTINPDYYNETGTAEILTTSMQIVDQNSIDSSVEVTVNKDQDLLFDLTQLTGWTSLQFSWVDNPTTPLGVSWNISYDCYFAGSNEYITDKFVFDLSNGANYLSNSTLPRTVTPPAGYFNVSWSLPNLTITNQGCGAGGVAQFLRIKPVTDSSLVTINSMQLNGASVPLVRKIRTVTSSANSQNTDNPSAVLETTYFLGESPLSLFDYVLRTEGDVEKTN